MSSLALWLGGGVERWPVEISPSDFRRLAWVLFGILFFAPPLRERSLLVTLGQTVWKVLVERSVWRWALLAAVAGWAVLLGAFQTLALRFTIFDVGIFHQVLWSMVSGEGFWSTLNYGNGNFLSDHFSPSLALLAPFFDLLGRSPLALGILQPFLLFGGVAAWVRLAERMPGLAPEARGRLAAGALIFGVTFQSVWANLRWGFHENSIGFLAMSWALCGWMTIERELRRRLFVLVMLLIAAGTKEIYLLNIAGFFAYWAYRDWRAGMEFRSLGSIAWAGILLGTFLYYHSLPRPPGHDFLALYYSYYSGGGVAGFVATVLGDPLRVIREIGARELVTYLYWLALPLFPLVFLFPLTKGWRGLTLAIAPSFFSAFLSTWPNLRRTGSHYVLEVWPVLVVLTLIVLARRPRWIAPWVFVGVYLLAQDPWNQMRDFAREASANEDARRALSEIAPEARVISEERGGTWVAGRKYATKFPDRKLLRQGCADVAVFRDDTWQGIRDSVEMRGLARSCHLAEGYEDPPLHGEWRIGPLRPRRND